MDPVALKKRLGDKFSVPSLPKVVRKVNEMLTDPKMGMRDIGAAIGQDPPLTAKLLQTANSAYYGLREQVQSAEHAAAILGLRALRNLVMQVALVQMFPRKAGGVDLVDFWRHSILTAQLCGRFPEVPNQKHGADEIYLCGLLHDIGVFVMLDALSTEFLEIYKRKGMSPDQQERVEKVTFGFSHTEVGALIAMRWNMPEIVVRAIRYHHDSGERISQDIPTAVTFTSSQIASKAIFGGGARIPGVVCELLKLDSEGLAELQELALELLPDIEI